MLSDSNTTSAPQRHFYLCASRVETLMWRRNKVYSEFLVSNPIVVSPVLFPASYAVSDLSFGLAEMIVLANMNIALLLGSSLAIWGSRYSGELWGFFFVISQWDGDAQAVFVFANVATTSMRQVTAGNVFCGHRNHSLDF